jgi:hypothetical protein
VWWWWLWWLVMDMSAEGKFKLGLLSEPP